MTTLEQIFAFLCDLAPLELQMDFDNSGLLIGRRGASITKALLALDITDEVIGEAIEECAQLIISHHPIIFHKLGSVSDMNNDDRVLRMAENGIAAICMHTNLDISSGGVNDVLIDILGASSETPLDADGCGRIGTLPEPMPMISFLQRCKSVLKVNGLRYVDAGKEVYRLAVMGGAGGDALYAAVEKGCDTYVTADVKYHQFLDAARMGINLIDADHFCTENPVIPVLAEKLGRAFPDVSFSVSSRHHALISFI
ncbi:MAG: Nif3-like dinuclear metal center hexameric protein [Oscillospiraceae bacterium]|nr:Nif3-like dinuclear metal center hexameric protein [Oscillospiraceae bacterium]